MDLIIGVLHQGLHKKEKASILFYVILSKNGSNRLKK